MIKKEKDLTWQSNKRKKNAIREGREIGRDGAPPYLEKNEIIDFKNQIREQVRMGHYLSLDEMSMLVF
jgi:hypothetical protein